MPPLLPPQMARSPGLIGEVVRFADLGQDFLQQKTPERVVRGIVFHAAVAAGLAARLGGGELARADENPDGDRHFLRRDQIVEDVGGVVGSGLFRVALGAAAVLEDHHARGPGAVVLRRDVEPPVVGRAVVDFGMKRRHRHDLATGDALFGAGIGAEGILVVGGGGG